LAYDKKLEEFLPEDHRKNKLDIAEAIFGNSDSFAGRVFFEDAFLSEMSKDKINENVSIPKILGSPKPTTFQHYLEQNADLIKPYFDRKGKISGYLGINDFEDNKDKKNNAIYLRGNKLYWHKDGLHWKEEQLSFKLDDINSFLATKGKLLAEFRNHYAEDRGKIVFSLKTMSESQISFLSEAIDFKRNGQKIEKQHTRIRPIASGAKFSGRIRFENLTNVELGALLLSLKLKENLAHKLGMGKPLGLGSIKIKPSLFLSHIEERYSMFNSEWKLKQSDESKVDEIVNDFKKFILKGINSVEDPSKYWEIERIKELERMLDFNNSKIPNWEEKTRYMTIGQINEYRDRRVLPRPTKVK
jgi:CRISPR-associated protein (TIGR03986 family)